MKRVVAAALAGAALFACFSWYREHLVTRRAGPEERAVLLAGDEPHYLLSALALARGDGFDIGPAHTERAFERFQPKALFRTWYQFIWADYQSRGFRAMLDRGEAWGDDHRSLFSPLPAVLLAPLFLTPLDPVRWYALVAQALGLSLLLAWWLARCEPADAAAWRRGAFVLLAGCGAVPVGYYASALFPEVLTGGLLLGGLALLKNGAPPMARASGAALLALSLWATPRVLPALGLVWLWSCWPAHRERRLEMLVLALNFAAYAAFCLWMWGNPVAPQASTMMFQTWRALGPVGSVAVVALAIVALAAAIRWRVALSRVGWWWAAVPVVLAMLPPARGLLVDVVAFFLTRQVGLLLLNPFLLAAFAAAVWWYRKEPGDAFQRWLLLVVGCVLAVAFYQDRRAGTCPTGRYQVVVAMLLVYPLLQAAVRATWEERRRWWPGAVLLGVASLAVSFVVATKPNYWFRGYPALYGFKSVQSWYEFLPEVTRPWFLARAGVALALLLAALLLPGWVGGWFAGRARVGRS